MPKAPLVAWEGRPADAAPASYSHRSLDRIEARGHRAAGQPFPPLAPWKPRRVRIKEFSDVIVEFAVGPDGKVAALKQIDPSGELSRPGSKPTRRAIQTKLSVPGRID